MLTLHGYTFDDKMWETKGGNGQSVGAEKDGKAYFLKRLNKPKYPESDNFSGEFKRAKINECNAWLSRRKAISRALPGTGSGNIIKPIEYFREGARFYEVTNFVRVTSIPYTEIYKESTADKALMMMTIAKSLADVHEAGIVHGDLDPGNILISRSAAGRLITKLIDFTDAFFADDPPEAIMSKDAWWSPEAALYSKAHEQNPNPYKKYIGTASDVFSLGLIFHQYCTAGGEFPRHSGDYPWQGFAGGGKLTLDPSIEPQLSAVIADMLAVDPEKRPNMETVHSRLRAIGEGGAIAAEKAAPATPTSSIEPGAGKTKSGAFVSSAKISERNPKKVELIFSDGKTQIMDLALALKQGYAVKK